MRESSTYQAILLEGRVEEAQRLILKLGGKRFGPPGLAVHFAVDAISDLGQLEKLLERLIDASDWDDVFTGLPRPLVT